jgi:uncharacterized protein YdhG (YjbR/CyaY superfamily)
MNDGSGVEAYLAGLPEGSRAAMEQLRATIRAVAPGATETISYRMPAFKDRGRIIVYYAAFKDHYSVYPASDFVAEALGADLEPYLSGKGTIRFHYDMPLPRTLVKKIVEARLAENEVARSRRR